MNERTSRFVDSSVRIARTDTSSGGRSYFLIRRRLRYRETTATLCLLTVIVSILIAYGINLGRHKCMFVQIQDGPVVPDKRRPFLFWSQSASTVESARTLRPLIQVSTTPELCMVGWICVMYDRWEPHPWKTMQSTPESSPEPDRSILDRSATQRRDIDSPSIVQSSVFLMRSTAKRVMREKCRYGDGGSSSMNHHRASSPQQQHHHHHHEHQRSGVGYEDDTREQPSPPFLQSYRIPQAPVEMEWSAWDISPSSASNTSASLTPTRVFQADNLLSVASSAATSESTAGSDDSVLHPSTAADIAELACPIPDESVTIDQYGFIVRDGEHKSGSGVDPVKVCPLCASSRVAMYP